MATTMNPTTYSVTYTRQDGGWFAKAPDIRGAHSQGRSIESARANIKEAIALVLDLPGGAEDDMALTETIETGDDTLDASLSAAAQLREEAMRLNEKVQKTTYTVVYRMAKIESDLSSRDVGNILNISHQRANQLIKSAYVDVHEDDRDAIDA